MEYGLALPQLNNLASAAAVRTVAVAAERAGFASLWALDRLVAPLATSGAMPAVAPVEPRIVLDPIVALTTAAAITERIRLGTNVLIAPLYSPVMLARTAASLDHFTGGRFTLGLGLGASADDFAAAGTAMSQRQVRIEEMLEVMARVWRDDVVEIENSRETIVPSVIGLKPAARQVPLLLAGTTPASLERVARRANGWTPTGLSSSAVESRWATVRSIAERYGRDPDSLRLVVRANVSLTRKPLGANRREFAGSLAQLQRDVRRFEEIGTHELILDLHASASSATEMLERALSLTGMASISAAA